MKEGDSDPQEGSNAIDDGQTDILTDKADDPVREELLGAIRALNDEERIRLVALAWLGRGTFALDEWKEALATARSEHSRRAAEYLLGLPLLGDYLEDGLAMFDEGIVDDTDTREGRSTTPARRTRRRSRSWAVAHHRLRRWRRRRRRSLRRSVAGPRRRTGRGDDACDEGHGQDDEPHGRV